MGGGLENGTALAAAAAAAWQEVQVVGCRARWGERWGERYSAS